jgi:uncharacterized protein (TIGR01244 family)
MFRTLDETMFVAGQIGPEDIGAARALGVTMIVNNRPDGEEPAQPAGATIEEAARAAGIAYRHIPVSGAPKPEQAREMAGALAEARGPVLAFCRSGTRSTYLWALAEGSQGRSGAELIARAADAGYDLSPLAPHLPR